MELETTNTDSSIVQYASVKEKSPYQGLSPSPDGAMERGLYTGIVKFILIIFNDILKKCLSFS